MYDVSAYTVQQQHGPNKHIKHITHTHTTHYRWLPVRRRPVGEVEVLGERDAVDPERVAGERAAAQWHAIDALTQLLRMGAEIAEKDVELVKEVGERKKGCEWHAKHTSINTCLECEPCP